MVFEKRREVASFLMRVFVGCILVYSAYIKIIEPFESFYSSILSYKVVSEGIAYYTARFLPFFELYLGLFLISGLFLKESILLSLGLFSIFEILLLQAIVRKLDVANCGCFGSSHSNPIGVEFGLNIIWIFFLIMSYRYSKNITLDNYLEKKLKNE